MKSAVATILFGLFVSIASAQVDQLSPEKLPSFETIARKGETKVIWSMEVGHLTAGECHAVFTTLIVEDSMPEYRRLRGVRLDLSQPRWKTSLYIDECLLQPLNKIFDNLAVFLASIPDLIKRGILGSDTRIGPCEGRRIPGKYPLTADLYLQSSALANEPGLPVLIVNGVWFPGLMPSQVSDVLGKAIDELKKR
jgi:hypothetical protein